MHHMCVIRSFLKVRKKAKIRNTKILKNYLLQIDGTADSQYLGSLLLLYLYVVLEKSVQFSNEMSMAI